MSRCSSRSSGVVVPASGGWVWSRLTVLVGLLLIVGVLSPVTAVPAGAASVVVEPSEDGDVPLEESRPLGTPSVPQDPAADIDRLSDTLSDLPDEQTSTVDVDEDWTEVPGIPVEVRVPDDPDGAPEGEGMAGPDPSDSATSSPAPSASASPAGFARAAASPTSSGAETPSGEPSADAEGGQQVDVALDFPAAGPRAGRFFLTFDPAQPEPGAGSSPSASGAVWRSTGVSGSTSIASVDDPGTPLEVRLDYGGFANAFGGAWFDRLQVVAYPACFVSTPADPLCATGVPVEFSVDAADRLLKFTTVEAADVLGGQALVAVPDDTDGGEPSREPSASRSGSRGASSRSVAAAAASVAADPSGGGVVYSVGGSGGNYGATPLTGSAAWQVGPGSGEFSYSYPFALPDSVGGAAPDLALNYSSSSVDGMTSASNGQASAAGIGWNLSTAYITRSYQSCTDDGLSSKGDLCWKTSDPDGAGGADGEVVNDFTIVLNGKSSRLVQVENSNLFRLVDDPGWRVERIVNDGYVNGDDNQEHFSVLTPDGTRYSFGYSEDSTQVVPVFGDDPGEPCYDSSLAEAFCRQAWQWNLDKVTDVHGNVTRYSYDEELNYYARWGNTSTPAWYDRGARLSKIVYGYDGSGIAHQVVDVLSVKRCTKTVTDPSQDCTGSESPRNAPSLWPDVPSDLLCDSSSCLVGSPTFFTAYRYYQVRTKTVAGTTAASAVERLVDVYSLSHTLPDPDDSGPDQPDLWLLRVDHTGYGPSVSDTMPGFLLYSGGEALRNRVVESSGQRAFRKYRVSGIRTELGGRIDVTYGHAVDGEVSRACTADYVESITRNQSTKECFAQRYAPPGGLPRWLYFHKYVVTRVALSDMALGYRYQDSGSQGTDLGQLRVYDYDYNGAPAWRYVRDRNIASDDESWDDWRGYQTTVINTRKTAANDYQVATGYAARSRVTVFRGMNGARADNSGGTIDATVTTEDGASQLDQPWLQGHVAETKTFDGDNAAIGLTTRRFGALATAADNAGPDSHIVFESSSRARTYSANGAADLLTTVANTVDDGGSNHRGLLAGVVTETSTSGATDTGSTPATSNPNIVLTSCVQSPWTGSTAAWVRAPKSSTTYRVSCSALPEDQQERSSYIISATQNCYDDQTIAPGGCEGSFTTGDLTTVKAYTKSGTYDTNKYTYDGVGRVKTQTDGRDKTTTYTYNPGATASDLLTQVRVTQPAVADGTFVSTTTLDPRRGASVSVKDYNDKTTTLAYDGLGRLTEVTFPDNTSSSPSIQYQYSVDATQPSRVRTWTLRSGATSTTSAVTDASFTFYDGWGRTVETQQKAPEVAANPDYPNQRIVSVTGYDEQGLAQYSAPAIANSNVTAPFTTVLNPDITGVALYTRTSYDGAQRPVLVQEMSQGAVQAATSSTYGGRVTVVDPASGGDTRTVIDPWGRTEQVDQYEGAAGTSGVVRDSVGYEHDDLGHLTKATKQLGSATFNWTWSFDWAGRQVGSSDPDTGSTETLYDGNANPTQVTTALGTTSTTYDALNRPLTLKHGSAVVGEWTYDTATNGNGLLAKVTSTNPHLTTTEATLSGHIQEISAYTAAGNPTRVLEKFPSAGYVRGATDADRVTTYAYLTGGLLKSASYDSVRTVAGVDVLPASTVAYAYDTRTPVPTSINVNDGGAASRTAADYDYDYVGRTTRINSTNNLVTTGTTQATTMERAFSWQSTTGRLDIARATSVTNNGAVSVLRFRHYYDKVGNPLTITTSSSIAGAASGYSSACYTYDGLNRLKSANAATTPAADSTSCGATGNTVISTATYAYDPSGDRLTSVTAKLGTAAARIATYSYPFTSKPHQVQNITLDSATGASAPSLPTPGGVTWAANGSGRATTWSPTGGTAREYAYDTAGRLTKSRPSGAGDTVGTVDNAFAADGTRIARRTLTAADAHAVTLYYGDVEVDATNTGGGAYTITSARRTITTANGTPLAVQQRAASSTGGTTWTWFFADRQNTVRQTVTSTAVQNYHYTPYGAPIAPTGTTTTAQPATPGNRGYLVQTHDPTGEIRLDQRSYNPTLNILLTPDPLLDPGDPQTLNPYAYARNNPTTLSDPSGLAATCVKEGTCVNKPDPTGKTPPAPGKQTPAAKAAAQSESAVLWFTQGYEQWISQVGNSDYCDDHNCDLVAEFGQWFDWNRSWGSDDALYQAVREQWGYALEAGGIREDWVTDAIIATVATAGLSLAAGAVRGMAGAGVRGLAESGAANAGPKALPSGPKITAQWGADTYRHGGLMSTIEHINYRHAFNSGFRGVSRFGRGTSARDVKGYVDYVLRNGTITDRGMIGNVGRTIGTDVAGNPVNGLEVIVRNGIIKSAFPVAVP